MADRDFRIDLILGAKFAQAFAEMKKADARVRGLGKTVEEMNAKSLSASGAVRATAATAVATATAVTAVMGLYIAKTIEAEKVQAQLGARVKDTAGVAGRSLAQLNEQAGKLQNITVFDDEAIGNAQAMLLTFTQIRGVNFDRTIEASLDLATVMGTDATDAAKVLGKALSDPVKGLSALSRAGVTFTEAERERIKTMVEAGQIAEAQGVILDKLSGKMGTAAEAARDTLGGAVQALKNAFDNLLEGDSGDAGIKGTRGAIESLITTLNDPDVKAGFDGMVSGIVNVSNEVVRGIALLSNYAAKYRNIAALGSGDTKLGDADEQALNDRLEAVSKTRRLLEKGGTVSTLKAIYGADSVLTGGDLLKTREEVIARLRDESTQIIREMTRRNRAAIWSGVVGGSQTSYDQVANPTPEGQGIAKPGKSSKAGGTKADPDAAAKKRLAALQEELYLINAIEDGEDKASAAAQARYDTTQGEYAKASPALKAQIVAAAEAVDQANAAKRADKERAEAIEKSEAAYQDLLETMRTPAERAIDDAITKLGTLDEAIQRAAESKREFDQAGASRTRSRIVDSAFEDAPDVGGMFGVDLDPFAEDRARLEAWYEEQLQKLAEFRAARSDLNAEWDAREREIETQHQQGLANLQLAQGQLMLTAASSFFGSLADIARSGAGEQSKTYRTLFAISKGFAVAEALIAVYKNAAEASKQAGGFPYNIPIIAGAIAQGMAIVAQIRAVNPGTGYAEGGYTGPGGKYQPAGIVHKGEGVLTQEQISALGGPGGFYALSEAIDDGRMRELLYGWAGYVNGGMVASPDAALAPIDWASHPQGMPRNGGGSIAIYNYSDINQLRRDILNHPDADKRFVAVAAENGKTIKASW